MPKSMKGGGQLSQSYAEEIPYPILILGHFFGEYIENKIIYFGS